RQEGGDIGDVLRGEALRLRLHGRVLAVARLVLGQRVDQVRLGLPPELGHVVVRVGVLVALDAVAPLAGVDQQPAALGVAAGRGGGGGIRGGGGGGGGVLGDGGSRDAQAGGDQQRSDHGFSPHSKRGWKRAACVAAQSRQYSGVVNANPTTGLPGATMTSGGFGIRTRGIYLATTPPVRVSEDPYDRPGAWPIAPVAAAAGERGAGCFPRCLRARRAGRQSARRRRVRGQGRRGGAGRSRARDAQGDRGGVLGDRSAGGAGRRAGGGQDQRRRARGVRRGR